MGPFLIVMGMFALLGGFGWLIFSFFKRQKKRWPLLTMVGAIVLFSIGGSLLPPDDSSKSAETASSKKVASSSKSKSSKKSAKSSSSVKAKQVASKSSSSASSLSSSGKESNLKKANDDIAKTLKEQQGWANGTLDKNGNPTQNGTPNPAFDFANTISSIQWGSDNQIKVQVNPSFLALTDDAKSQAATKTQNMAMASASQFVKVTDEQFVGGIGSYFYYGSRAIGHTKITDQHQYTWYK